jgi:nucleotide-binding universal stress UspA family protein
VRGETVSSRSIVLVPVDRATNVELVTQVATALAAPGAADIHILNVTPSPQSWHVPADWRERPRVLANNQSARTETGTLSADREGTIRDVRLRGSDERIISGYAQLTGARAIVVDRHYGSTPLWRSTAVVARMSRLSPVPVLALPSEGPALERWARGNISAVVAAVDTTLASAVALRTGIALAARHGARLTMIHALENFPGHSVFSGSEAWRVVQQLSGRQREVAERLESQAMRLGQAAAVAHVVTGAATHAIVSAASETSADVIVMGVAPRMWLDRALFGSTLGGVLRRAQVPVLVVPVVGGAEEWSDEAVGREMMAGVPSQSTTPRIAA